MLVRFIVLLFRFQLVFGGAVERLPFRFQFAEGFFCCRLLFISLLQGGLLGTQLFFGSGEILFCCFVIIISGQLRFDLTDGVRERFRFFVRFLRFDERRFGVCQLFGCCVQLFFNGFCFLLRFLILLQLAQVLVDRFELTVDLLHLVIQRGGSLFVRLVHMRQRDQCFRIGKLADYCLLDQRFLFGSGDTDDFPNILRNAVLHLICFALGCIEFLAQPLLQLFVVFGAEDLAKNPLALLSGRQQQLSEITLRDHCDTHKLFTVNAEDLRDFGGDFLGVRDRRAVWQDQFCIGGLLGLAVTALFGTPILRIALDRIGFSVIFKRQLHKGVGVRIGIFGAQHFRFACFIGGFTVERIDDRVKDRRFACAGVACDQVDAALAELAEINRRFARVRTECGHR